MKKLVALWQELGRSKGHFYLVRDPLKPHNENLRLFSLILEHWWLENKREFPWRSKLSLYEIAVAELMLRRTRADQVVPVYLTFLQKYPTLEAAARANPDELRTLLYPLGLTWRADDMRRFFIEAFQRFGCALPDNVKELQTLPGVGDYVSNAIACFGGGQNVALIDTNVVRVLGRVFGVSTIGEARRRKEMRELAIAAVDAEKPSSYHFSLLDFAARICVAAKPHCHICPFRHRNLCEFYINNFRDENSPPRRDN